MKKNILFVAPLLVLLAFPCFADSLEFTKKAAELGDAKAQHTIGYMYEYGKGLPKNQSEAAKWYTKAAEQGFAEAQNNLGFMYANGNGVIKDPTQAMKWYGKAAEQGLSAAQYNFGVMHTNSQAAPVDYVKAYMWANLAAAKNNKNAIKMRTMLEKNLKKEQIEEGQRLSNEWLEKHPEKPDAKNAEEAQSDKK